ncbi:unnamed protein product [Prorocentrum cordatum]|uniref:Uncharacterized protein n=1 Tax=Prorocentrum cordatum TaxID=2364126 RepID=A0ABN9U6N3_9DINO|nr:unnamed protein product [Polarella glacialis]
MGPYVVDAGGSVRVLPPSAMPGRLTGVARHLSNPTQRVYIGTMEEGLYDVDLATLQVTEVYADDQGHAGGRGGGDRRLAGLPGYHGKGLYSGQGRLVYANNGETGREAQRRPDVPSGCLAEWDGSAWKVVRRNQFTEVTGPGGIYGSPSAQADPIWTIGWDHRSLLLMVLDSSRWSTYRLPKASHTYDGAHGWNTEWPRIREVGEASFLMTMHGTLWRFPPTFAARASAGVLPISTYLKVCADFARWREWLVFGCDDVARKAFLNKRRAKDSIPAPERSHSNLWFAAPQQLDQLGPPLGRGAVWLNESVPAGQASDPFLFSGYDLRGVHVAHGDAEARTFTLQVDRAGDGTWAELEALRVPAGAYRWQALRGRGAWVRARLDRAAVGVTVQFAYRQTRRCSRAWLAEATASVPDPAHSRWDSLAVFAAHGGPEGVRQVGAYELRLAEGAAPAGGAGAAAALRLEPSGIARTSPQLQRKLRIAAGLAEHDGARGPKRGASWLHIDDDGRRWRLPAAAGAGGAVSPVGPSRMCREVVTERDLEGLLVVSGLQPGAPAGAHVVRSADGGAAVWAGDLDDLWRLGRPRGAGGPWLRSARPVAAGVPSDPYLLAGFAQRGLSASHSEAHVVGFRLEVDATGTGSWHAWRLLAVPPGEGARLSFPAEFEAYWLRAVSNASCSATLQLVYD